MLKLQRGFRKQRRGRSSLSREPAEDALANAVPVAVGEIVSHMDVVRCRRGHMPFSFFMFSWQGIV